MREGTIVYATIIAAPSSTKDHAGQRNSEMHQVKKGNQWHFGMKAQRGERGRQPKIPLECPRLGNPYGTGSGGGESRGL